MRVPGKAKALTAALLALLIALPGIGLVFGPTQASMGYEPGYKAMIDPRLLQDETFAEPIALLKGKEVYSDAEKALEIIGDKLKPLREGQVKIFMVVDPSVPVDLLNRESKGVFEVFKIGNMRLVEAWASKEDIEDLASIPGVYYIGLYVSPVDSIVQEARSKINVGSFAKDKMVGGEAPSLYEASEVMGASRVWEEFNITGEGVVVAVVDTGVDFGNSDLGEDAIARENGVPLIFDTDQAGIVLTLVEATKTENDTIQVETPVLFYDGFFLSLGETDAGFFLYVSRQGSIFYEEFPIEEFYVGDIESGTGIFKFGLFAALNYILYGNFGFMYYTVPIIVVDSDGDSLYDTAYADLSTIYYFFLKALNETGVAPVSPDPSLFDLSFADEKPLSFGSEVAARDFNGDGVNDFSIGALAGYVYDFIGLFTGEFVPGNWTSGFDYGGAILPGFDPLGNYITIAYDWLAHGTSVASVIAGRGVVPVDLGYGTFALRGIAPGAKLAANTGLINPFAAQMFFSGHDKVGLEWEWVFTGAHKADVISNSWGNSFLLLIGFASGMGPYSILEDYIVANTDTVISHAMGNGGPGFGTATTPGAASLVVSVGASTLFDYRPIYGYLPGGDGEVVSWSDRGPTQLGVAQPDVVNIGSFAFAMAPVNVGLGDGRFAFDLFGGTSEATPMTSGAIALIIEAYREAFGTSPSPGTVKSILKSTARDLGYDAYTQGAGHVDAYRAVKSILEGGEVIASTMDTFNNIYGMIQGNSFIVPDTIKPEADTQLYTGVMKPGESKTLSLDLRTFGGEVSAELSAVWFHSLPLNLLDYLDLDRGVAFIGGQAMPLSSILSSVDSQGGEITVTLDAPSARIFIPISDAAFQNAEMVEFVAWIPYSIYDPEGREGIYGFVPGLPWIWMGIEVHLGIDVNNNGVIDLPSETSRLNYDIRYANNFHVTIGKPFEKFQRTIERVEERLGLDLSEATTEAYLDIRVIFNGYYYLGQTLDLPIKFELRKIHRLPFTWIEFSETSVTVNEEGTSVDVTVSVPPDAQPGVYEAYVIIEYDGRTTLVPVSIPVAAVATPDSGVITLSSTTEESYYKNYQFEGQFDWSWRYESGDWRTIPVITEDPSIIGFIVKVEWMGYNSSVDVGFASLGIPFLAGEPDEFYYGAVTAAKLTLPLYRSGWFPHYDYPTPQLATIFAPVYPFAIDVPHWVVLHNTLIDASDAYPEQYTLKLIPVRASPLVFTVPSGEETTITLELTSFALSNAMVVPLSVVGDAQISSMTTTLGYGFTHELNITLTATTPSTIILGVALDRLDQYNIGFMWFGDKVTVLEAKGFALIAVQVIPQE